MPDWGMGSLGDAIRTGLIPFVSHNQGKQLLFIAGIFAANFASVKVT